MRQIFLSISLLLAAVILVGCEENQTETEEEAQAEVTARLFHIARIGNLAEIPDDLWENGKTQESTENPGGPALSGEMQEAPVAKAVGDEVDPDVLAIVESTARESTTEEGLQRTQEKEKELDLVVEMVQEAQETEAEVEMFQESGQQPAGSAENGEEDDDEEVDIPMGGEQEAAGTGAEGETGEGGAPQGVKSSTPGKKKPKSGQKTKAKAGGEAEGEAEAEAEGEAEEEAEGEEGAENPEENTGEEAEDPDEENPLGMNPGVFEEEVERQAEEFLKVLQNTPGEVRAELKKAHFQNVTYRLVKVPGMLIQGGADEYLIIRTMEYTGTNLAHDYQMLNLSPNYSAWLLEQEKYLEIMTLDSLHHEIWVEVPEFWKSSEE